MGHIHDLSIEQDPGMAAIGVQAGEQAIEDIIAAFARHSDAPTDLLRLAERMVYRAPFHLQPAHRISRARDKGAE
jgi:hypothetical protein